MTLMKSRTELVGETMPRFELDDPNGETHASEDLMGENGLLVVFTCNHCPYAQAAWPHLLELAPYAEKNGVNVVAVNPNIHPDYPDDSPEKMKDLIVEKGVDFPYLVDETQNVAKQYGAVCTPDLYLCTPDMKLVYHGRIGSQWRTDSLETEELREAINAVAQGNLDNIPAGEEQHPSMGCSIKWRNK